MLVLLNVKQIKPVKFILPVTTSFPEDSPNEKRNAVIKIAPTQRIQAAPNVLYQELDGESVLLNLGNEQYYGLDQVGTRMWSLLTTAPSLAEAKQMLLAEYEVEPAQLEHDLQQLLTELLTQGLVTAAA